MLALAAVPQRLLTADALCDNLTKISRTQDDVRSHISDERLEADTAKIQQSSSSHWGKRSFFVSCAPWKQHVVEWLSTSLRCVCAAFKA